MHVLSYDFIIEEKAHMYAELRNISTYHCVQSRMSLYRSLEANLHDVM